MTWSLLARDAQGRFGVAIASRFFSVGSLCVHTQGGVGAVATQALINPLYGPQGLALLAAGHGAADVMKTLTGADAGHAQRQVHLLPAQGAGVGAGAGAAHTGSACVGWCGHLLEGDFSVAGNMLAGPRVLEATAEAFVAGAGQPLAQRLITAMQAGEAAGGDKRGRQSAALRIHGAEAYAELDLRVDDHADPLAELTRLHAKSLERYQPFVACLPRHGHPAGETDRSRIEAAIDRFHAARRGEA